MTTDGGGPSSPKIRGRKDLVELRNHFGYHFINIIDSVVHNYKDFRIIYEIFLDGGYLDDFMEPFKKFSALHGFIWQIADQVLGEELQEAKLVPFQPKIPTQAGSGPPRMALPLENMLEKYDIGYESLADFKISLGQNVSSTHADLVNEYHHHLFQTKPHPLSQLINRIVDEAFFVLFANRSFLVAFNQMIADFVCDLEPNYVEEGNKLLKVRTDDSVRLKRVSIPNWAKRAVEFRERGRCAHCHLPLGTFRTPIERSNFDHMVPLNLGGLNDVSNIQLLCMDCNNQKSGSASPAELMYERWYPI